MAPHLPKPTAQHEDGATQSREVARRLTWEIRSISVCLEDIRDCRANALGITGPQLLILMALTDLNEGNGAPGNVVAKLMKVDPSFVTIHSKVLETKGFVRRKPCASDARVMQLVLTDKACKRLASISAQQEELDQLALGDLGPQELTKLAGSLSALRHRLEGARARLEMAQLGQRRTNHRKWRSVLRV